MIIRKAKKADLDGVYKVFLDFDKALTSYLPKKFKTFRCLRSPKQKSVKEALLKDIRKRKALFLVAEDEGKIKGYIFGELHLAKGGVWKYPLMGGLMDLAVKKEYRGKGIASKLWRELLKWFKENNCKYLQLQCIKDNPAVKIYKKWGFETSVVKMRMKL